jgi:hypothetical protein
MFGLFAVATLWLTFHLHSKTGYFTYKSEIFSDKAGYYSYLPATFIYRFDGLQVADTLPKAIGKGFIVDDQGHIVTKYPIGVAIMQAPFFLVTHYFIAPLLGYPADGFSPPYHRMIDVAAWVYLLLAMALMARVLGEYFKQTTVWATLACFFLGTNLCYYYSVESGMSHIYSFFLVTALIRLTQILHRRRKVDGTPTQITHHHASIESILSQTTHQHGKVEAWLGLAIGAVAGLLVVTRFTNMILVSVVVFWDVKTWQELKNRLRMLFQPKALATMLAVPLILIGLQMTYYCYLSGSPFHYSYGNEGFDFLHPQILKVWFSPHNGLFPYAPMIAFALIGLGLMAKKRLGSGWFGIGIFLIGSLVFASWHQWYFGCAYGARSFVELYPILLIGFAFFLEWLAKQSNVWRITGLAILGLLCVICFMNMYFYPLCYYGNGDWDWAFILSVK